MPHHPRCFWKSHLLHEIRIPLYLDSIGTMTAGALFGPLWGMVPGAVSALLNGVTTDPYALYYLPVQLITGALAGLVFQKIRVIQDGKLHLVRLFPAAVIVSLPGTVVSSSVTAFLFGGITSSGSTILVQLLHGMGLNMTASVCAVQALTDYLDRFACLALAAVLVRAIPAQFRIHKNGGKHRGTL